MFNNDRVVEERCRAFEFGQLDAPSGAATFEGATMGEGVSMRTKAVLDEVAAGAAAELSRATGAASAGGAAACMSGTVAVAGRPAEDRRITRTKRALRGALIALMEERGLDAITVNDLCARADINRGTFYNHYRDKDDLLAVLENEVLADLDRYQVQMADLSLPQVVACQKLGRPLSLLVSLFEYLKDQGDFLHAVLGPGGDGGFGPRLRDSICTNLVESILHERYRANPTSFVRYYVSFFASAYLGVIERWICTGMKESPREMAIISLRLLFIKPGERIEL